MLRTTHAAIVFALAYSIAFAGARFDLRPAGVTITPSDPPYAVVTPGQTLDVDVFLVDTGNPQGSISFRTIFLDFTDTSNSIVDSNGWAGVDGVFLDNPNTPQYEIGDNAWVFNWIWPCGIDCLGGSLPYAYWVYPSAMPNPGLQITLPENGEVQLGDIQINVPSRLPAIIDLMNADGFDLNLGVAAAFGFGGADDPNTIWRAYTGELTGGQLLLVPEPGTLIVLGIAGVVAFRRTHQSRERKRPVCSETARNTG